MNSREPGVGSNDFSSSPSLAFSSVPDWGEPLTEHELEAIDAIEATFLSASTTSISSSIKEQDSSAQDDQASKRPCRRLPSSMLDFFTPFPLSPCKADVKMRYPAIKFGGRISYTRTSVEVEKAARELLRSLEAKRGESGHVAVGFDIEWKPTFRKGMFLSEIRMLCAFQNAVYSFVKTWKVGFFFITTKQHMFGTMIL
ncbi:unnamed protein product [Linum tenue]|uniref:Werner Syndrome-like exonuclease n=1 Tax=Linum tenue TaxID=586396 RepID=A0AAV0LUA0_9ROSI|nr:unnamed protein product [Linum tenue]